MPLHRLLPTKLFRIGTLLCPLQILLYLLATLRWLRPTRLYLMVTLSKPFPTRLCLNDSKRRKPLTKAEVSSELLLTLLARIVALRVWPKAGLQPQRTCCSLLAVLVKTQA